MLQVTERELKLLRIKLLHPLKLRSLTLCTAQEFQGKGTYWTVQQMQK